MAVKVVVHCSALGNPASRDYPDKVGFLVETKLSQRRMIPASVSSFFVGPQ